jgi:4a-hydroxytetrahydrobiopterin dehydratase
MKLGETKKYLRMVPSWKLIWGKKIWKEHTFKNFKEALAFVNSVGTIAEREGHHPDILMHSWKKVRITLSTYAIGGLSINDFILAAKIDGLTFKKG